MNLLLTLRFTLSKSLFNLDIFDATPSNVDDSSSTNGFRGAMLFNPDKGTSAKSFIVFTTSIDLSWPAWVWAFGLGAAGLAWAEIYRQNKNLALFFFLNQDLFFYEKTQLKKNKILSCNTNVDSKRTQTHNGFIVVTGN